MDIQEVKKCLFCTQFCQQVTTPSQIETEQEFITPDNHYSCEIISGRGVQNDDAVLEFGQETTEDIQNNLKAFLVLKSILKLPHQKLCEFITQNSGQFRSERWANFCENCELKVRLFHETLQQVSKLERTLAEIEVELKVKMVRTKDKNQGANAEWSWIRNEAMNHCPAAVFEQVNTLNTNYSQPETIIHEEEIVCEHPSVLNQEETNYDHSEVIYNQEETKCELVEVYNPEEIIVEPPEVPDAPAIAFVIDHDHSEDISEQEVIVQNNNNNGVEEFEFHLAFTDMDVDNEQIIYVYDNMEPSSSSDEKQNNYSSSPVFIEEEGNEVDNDQEAEIVEETENVVEETDDKENENEEEAENGCDDSRDTLVPSPPTSSSSNPGTDTGTGSSSNFSRRKAPCYYKCDSCPFETNNRTRLESHIICHDTGSGAIICTHCGQYLLQEKMARHLTVVHGYPSGSRKRSRKSPPRPVRTVDEDFNVQLEFMDVKEEQLEVESVKENGIKQEVVEVEMIIPEDEEPSYSTPSILLLDGVVKLANDVHHVQVQHKPTASPAVLVPPLLPQPLPPPPPPIVITTHPPSIAAPTSPQSKKKKTNTNDTPHTPIISPSPDFPLKPKKYKKSKMTSAAATSTIIYPLPGSKTHFYKCEICPFSSSSVVRFRTHMKVHDYGSDAISCSDCGRFVMPKNFGRHQAKWHLISKKNKKSAAVSTVKKSSGNNSSAAPSSIAIVNGKEEEVNSNSLFLDMGLGAQEVAAAPDDEHVPDDDVAQVIQTEKKPELDWNGDVVEKKWILGTVRN